LNPDRIEEFLEAIKPDNQYNNFLKGRRIAVVGPSSHILLRKDGKRIDNYDVVMRLKWLPIVASFPDKAKKIFNPFKEFIGVKTDVMYSSVINDNSDFKILSQNGVRYSRHPVGKEKVRPSSGMFENVFVKSYSSEEYAFLLKEYASQNGYQDDKLRNINSTSFYNLWPQLGFNAIMEAIASDSREVYITGFTMYHGGGHMLQKNKPKSHNSTVVGKHNGILESLILLDTIKYFRQNNSVKNIVLDPVLKMILDGYEGLEPQMAGTGDKRALLTSKMSEITAEINHLTRDL
jgi:hypothetical protein